MCQITPSIPVNDSRGSGCGRRALEQSAGGRGWWRRIYRSLLVLNVLFICMYYSRLLPSPLFAPLCAVLDVTGALLLETLLFPKVTKDLLGDTL